MCITRGLIPLEPSWREFELVRVSDADVAAAGNALPRRGGHPSFIVYGSEGPHRLSEVEQTLSPSPASFSPSFPCFLYPTLPCVLPSLFF